MRASRSEFEATVRKAARGADWPPSLAEDLSCATGALAATGGNGGEMALRVIEGDQRDRLAEHLSAFEMATIGEAAKINDADGDLLSACALSFGVEHGVGFAFTYAGADVQIELTDAPDVEIVEINVDEGVWTRLIALAHKSYVPASEASRLAGAGAGLTDND